MANGFATDLPALTAAAQRAKELTETFRAQTNDALTEPVADFGHPGLARAVSSFHSRWHTGLSVFAAEGDSVSERLGTTADSYRGVEQANTSTFTQIADGRG
jgi:hypothetical protein